MTKEQFIDMLRFMSKKYKQENKLCSVLEEMSDEACYSNAFVYSEYSEKLLELLMHILNDKDNDISYFLYELNGIDDVDIVVPDDKCPKWNDKILYNSASSLYDYLTGGR